MKKYSFMIRPLAVLFFLITATTSVGAYAQDRYITDKLFVPLRSGMGNQYRIVHKGLPSGYKLEFLEEATDDNGVVWSRVRTPRGLEGWVRQQYIFSEPTAAVKLKNLTEKISRLDGNQKQLLDEHDALQQENTTLKKQQTVLQDTLKKTNREYVDLRKLSANTVQLNEQYKNLNETHQILQTRAEVLTAENEMLKNSQRHSEWIFGAFILIIGIIVSFILQSIGRRKRHSEWR